jgi:hypothetical protein
MLNFAQDSEQLVSSIWIWMIWLARACKSSMNFRTMVRRAAAEVRLQEVNALAAPSHALTADSRSADSAKKTFFWVDAE